MAYTISITITDLSNHSIEVIAVREYNIKPFYDGVVGSTTPTREGQLEILFDAVDYNSIGLEEELKPYLVIVESEKNFISLKQRQGVDSGATDNTLSIRWKDSHVVNPLLTILASVFRSAPRFRNEENLYPHEEVKEGYETA